MHLADEPRILSHPELVIGIAGPIGIDIDAMTDEIDRAIRLVDYRSKTIRVTDLMKSHAAPGVKLAGSDYFSNMHYKMDYANKLCELANDPEFLMRIAIEGVRAARAEVIAERGGVPGEGAAETAFIVRQLKRPEEVGLMRRVYGKQFVLVSGYGSEEHRRERILAKGKASLPLSTRQPDLDKKVSALLLRDHDEGQSRHGQHLRDTFHRADVFVDGINRDQMRSGIERFFQAFFGRVDIGPTKVEYGMYAAKAAALRSTDLSRQVGAAAFTSEGEIVSQGCNEVPKAFGGTYWCGEEPDHRDVRLGYDPNDSLKKDVIRDLLELLQRGGLLAADKKTAASDEFVEQLLGRGARGPKHFGCLSDSQVNALTEYGRVVHAEMVTICDAARLGKRLKDCVLYVTTFPCHNCTKHILAAGLKKVFYLEPYPKSRAKQLHSNEIEIERTSASKVSFLPFLGISPFRYRDIFEKGSRKTGSMARTWYEPDDQPRPLVPKSLPAYIEVEPVEIDKMYGRFTTSKQPSKRPRGTRSRARTGAKSQAAGSAKPKKSPRST